MSAHTPGPWHAAALRYRGDPTRYGCDIGADNNSNVALVLHDPVDRGEPETIANARLIASAPAMAELLDDLLDCFDKQLYDERLRDDFDAPEDREYSVTLTESQFRRLGRVLILAGL